MNAAKRRFDIYLEDILISILRIEEYLGGMDFVEFKRNYLVVDAVVRNFEIIGEASKSIPEKIRIKYPSVPWRKMVGLRNLISHEYFGIDYEMIWTIAKNSLPQNRIDLQLIIETERTSES
jgi:uncharacterized protein with HEPN domain